MALRLCLIWLVLFPLFGFAQEEDASLLIVELNTENLFDTTHDSLKNDYDFLPDGNYHWSRHRYWQKVNRIGQTIIACGDGPKWRLPDLVALCEVENDSVLMAITKRSLLRKARYEYIMTHSPDERGIDVALLYSPFSFAPVGSQSIRIIPVAGMKPTRDILYVKGRVITGDTLHVFVVHAPSRSGGEAQSRPYRLHVATALANAIDSVYSSSPEAKVIVTGDFNDYSNSPSLQLLYAHGLKNVSSEAKGHNGAKATYRYHGEWRSLDQMLVSRNLKDNVAGCWIGDYPFLLEPDEKYGGVKPHRNYYGPRYNNGFSDHLPLVMELIL